MEWSSGSEDCHCRGLGTVACRNVGKHSWSKVVEVAADGCQWPGPEPGTVSRFDRRDSRLMVNGSNTDQIIKNKCHRW